MSVWMALSLRRNRALELEPASYRATIEPHQTLIWGLLLCASSRRTTSMQINDIVILFGMPIEGGQADLNQRSPRAVSVLHR